jgi:mRNA-degrading endonuclease RelE of RelBE toxin-antitoxin system
MPTKNPRINVVLTPRIYADLQTLSKTRGLSMSSVVEDLIEDVLEIQENIALAALVEKLKLRVGDYRIVFEFDRSMVIIPGIGHRKDIYNRMKNRIGI